MNIQLHNATDLSIREYEIAKCLQSTMIMDENQLVIQNEVTGIVIKSYVDAGFSMDERVISVLVNEIISDLKRNPVFRVLTIDEVKLAFNLGVVNEYGEYMGINRKTYNQWLNGYIKSQDRKNATKKMLPKPVEKVLTEYEKEKIVKEVALKAFEFFKINGDYKDYGNATYNYLDRLKLIPITKERKQKIKDEAFEFVILEYKNERDSKKDTIIRSIIDDSINEIELNKNDHRVIFQAKRMALVVYFKELVEMGMELKDVIK